MRMHALNGWTGIKQCSLTIREAVRADVPAMQDVVRRSFLVNYGLFMPWKAAQRWVKDDVIGQRVEREWESFIVAEIAGRIVGVLQLREHFVEELWVDPNRQRQGIGTALLTHGAALATEAGYTCLKVSVFAENLNALRFYLAQNWEPLGVPEPVELAPGAILHQQTLIKL